MDLAKVVTTKHPYVWEVGERSHEPIAVVGVKDEPTRFHVVAYDYGIKQTFCASWWRGLQSDGGSGADSGGGCAGDEAERRVSFERAGRSGAVHLCGGEIRRLMGTGADLRDLPGTSADRDGAGRQDVQAEVRAPRRKSSGKAVEDGKIEITAHNHNFAVDPDSLPMSEVELTHVDLNDNTLEGMRHKNLPLFSVQYHPEASPGPHDSHYLFRDFTKMMEEWKG